jgi:uncharacterized damage-inducible protein DinB
MHSQQEAALADLAAARKELLDALVGLSDADLESPLGPGEWRIRDMLAHISHWNRWGLNRLRYIIRHGEGTEPPSAIDADTVNQRIAEAWALHPMKDVLAEFECCYEDVVTFIRSLPPEWAARTWQYGGEPMTLPRWFGFAASHERDHAAQLRAWRATRQEG